MDPLDLLQELVSQPGPPGQEIEVRDLLDRKAEELGYRSGTDDKGNLIINLNSKRPPRVVVTAHMDEIAMMVTEVRPDGTLKVTSLGGLYPWKLGEGSVTIMAGGDWFEGVLGVGSIHTESPKGPAKKAKTGPLEWSDMTVFTGLPREDLERRHVRPGTRVVVAEHRRKLTRFGDFVAGHFLDDRADLVSWLLALEALKGETHDASFVATTCEEVGGEGALYYLQQIRPQYCIALELAPNVPDAPIVIDDRPAIWVNDGYSSTPPKVVDFVAGLAERFGFEPQFQALSRGGSDASCAAAKGLCAVPITIGLPMENSHGYEVMHKDAMVNLAKLTVALVQKLSL